MYIFFNPHLNSVGIRRVVRWFGGRVLPPHSPNEAMTDNGGRQRNSGSLLSSSHVATALRLGVASAGLHFSFPEGSA